VWTKPYFKVKILRLKCTKFDYGWDSASDPAGGVYSIPPDPLAVFKGEDVRGAGWDRRHCHDHCRVHYCWFPSVCTVNYRCNARLDG